MPRPGRSRRQTCGLLGLGLAAGAPAGLLALRLVVGRTSLATIGDDLRGELLTYAYVTVSTAIVFTAFGAALGQLADRLSSLAARDGLTGLLNRAGMLDRLAAEMRRQRRYPSAVSLLLIDVDRMKEINDRHGHAAGDDALRGVALAITAASRESDAASRWGGDEFLVLAPQTSLADAEVLASRIRGAPSTSGSGRPAPSVSIGIATVPPTDRRPSLDALLQAADDALYAAKRAGGNRVSTTGDRG
jgi:diguanylate cyclase (GGDEF)-like protein